MNTDELQSALKGWHEEYKRLIPCPDMPDTWFEFIARRLSEQGLSEDPWDVVVVSGEKYRLCGRSNMGARPVIRLEPYGPGKSGVRFMPIPEFTRAVEDTSRAADILDRIEQGG